ncbi:MAG: TolC family outer membrane protein [Pseudomonadota bacterium]
MARTLKGVVAVAALSLGLLGGMRAGAETLADALISAYRNSNLLAQNRAVLRAADEDVAAALAALRPVLGWVASSQYAKSPRTGEGTTNSVGLSLQWTVLDFGRGKLSREIARESVLGTRQALVGVEQNVLLSAVQAYMDVRSAVESVAINRNSVRVTGETLKAAQDRFDVGEVTRTDVAQAEAQLAASRAALAAAEGQLAAAREAYRAATGHYPGALSVPPRAPALPRSVNEATAIAQRNHPAILQAQHQVKVAELQVAAAAAQRLPTVNLSGQVTRDEFGNDTSSAGLSLNQTIYAGGALSSAHRKAIAGRDAAKAGLLQTSVSISQNVANAWAQIAVARSQISAIDQQIRAATVAYQGVKEEAALGSRTTLDVLNAEQDLLDAQSSRISAVANLQVAYYSLLSAMGLLTADRLNLPVPSFDPDAYYNAVRNAPVSSVQGRSLDRILKATGKN